MSSLSQHISVDCAHPFSLAKFWSQVLDLPVHPDSEPDDDKVGVLLDDGDRDLLFPKVPEPKTVKNRLHTASRRRDGSDRTAASRTNERSTSDSLTPAVR